MELTFTCRMARIKIKPVEKTRKILRKEKRQRKKINRAMFYQNKNQKQEKNDTEQTPSTKAQKRQNPKVKLYASMQSMCCLSKPIMHCERPQKLI